MNMRPIVMVIGLLMLSALPIVQADAYSVVADGDRLASTNIDLIVAPGNDGERIHLESSKVLDHEGYCLQLA